MEKTEIRKKVKEMDKQFGFGLGVRGFNPTHNPKNRSTNTTESTTTNTPSITVMATKVFNVKMLPNCCALLLKDEDDKCYLLSQKYMGKDVELVCTKASDNKPISETKLNTLLKKAGMTEESTKKTLARLTPCKTPMSDLEKYYMSRMPLQVRDSLDLYLYLTDVPSRRVDMGVNLQGLNLPTDQFIVMPKLGVCLFISKEYMYVYVPYIPNLDSVKRKYSSGTLTLQYKSYISSTKNIGFYPLDVQETIEPPDIAFMSLCFTSKPEGNTSPENQEKLKGIQEFLDCYLPGVIELGTRTLGIIQ